MANGAARPRGRPSTYDPTYCDQVIALGREGKSQVQISAALDIPRTTLLSWADRHEEFSTALARAKELEQAWWEEKAQSNLDNHKFNAALWAKNVASRFRADYGDKITQEHTGADGAPIEFRNLSEADIDKRLAELMAKAGGHV